MLCMEWWTFELGTFVAGKKEGAYYRGCTVYWSMGCYFIGWWTFATLSPREKITGQEPGSQDFE